MSKIEINDCVYNIHPVYNLYSASKDGEIVHIVKQIPNKGFKIKDGYLMCSVRKHGQNGQKNI